MKKFSKLVLVLLLVIAFATPCFAATLNKPELPRLVDRADLFNDAEETALKEQLTKLITTTGMDVLIMTDTGHGSYPNDEAYIEAVWDQNGFGVGEKNSGWAIFICMGCRSWCHTACGDASPYLTYDTVNIIDDYMQPQMANGRYADAMFVAISELDALFEEGPQKYASGGGGTVNPVKPEKEEKSFLDKLKLGGIVGVIAGLISGSVSKGSAQSTMKSIASAHGASGYAVPGSFKIRRSEDILLNVEVTRVRKEQDDRGSGHSGQSSYSGPHRSSNGNVHSSGGGRHF